MDLARRNCNSFNYANYTRCNIGENIEIRGISQLKKIAANIFYRPN